MYFRNSGLPKTSLDLCLESPVSKDATKSNMVNAPKHCPNFTGTSFTIFINHWEVNNILTKSLC